MGVPAWRPLTAAMAAAVCALAVAGSANAGDRGELTRPTQGVTWASDGLRSGLVGLFAGQTQFSIAGQHESRIDHLPSARENIELVGELELVTPPEFRFDPVTGDPDPTEPGIVDGQIADVSIYKNAAYLASWSEPTCARGGFFSVDISDPANPEQLAFVPSLPNTYHGEGMHTITLNTPDFQGDVLAVNNERCDGQEGHGFDLYDVSDPANPEILVQGAGDRSPDHAPGEAFGPLAPVPGERPNSAHSIFIWQDGTSAYAVIVDNRELSDVDIFDITDPTAPEFIADVDLFELAIDQGIDVEDNAANGEAIFNHDMVVKHIGGVPIMLVSYWDAGYIKLNVSDPANPVIIGDSAFDDEDPLVEDPRTGEGWAPPEGNGHQSEFSHDNKFVLAADEDFAQYRGITFIDPGGPNQFPITGWGNPTEGPVFSGQRQLVGPTVFVGDGCDPATIPLQSFPQRIAVIERGTCGFQIKVQNAEARGYDRVVVFNNAAATNGCETLLNMQFTGYTGNAVSVFLSRSVGMRLIGAFNPATYSCTMGGATTPSPAPPVNGRTLSMAAIYDGWGYMHLYDNSGDDLEVVDDFAIEEGTDERYAIGFGDLTVHEFATDATENLAYSSYYAGGVRVLSFGAGGLDEVGKFIDNGGNNFWGIEQFTTDDGQRLLAASDRDSGLYLLKYTGPGAAARPVCPGVSVNTTPGTPVSVPLTCTDANSGNTLTRAIAAGPASGTLGTISSGAVQYTPAAGFLGTATFTYTANDGAATSAPATATVIVANPPASPAAPVVKAGACANDLLGTAARDLLKGTAAGERIRGGAGNDVLDANSGDDCVLGEAGNDDLSGDAGNDDVSGGSGSDELLGGAGRDELDGGTGNDELSGGSGNDRVSGGSGSDELAGNAGTDTLRGGSGRDTIDARGGGRDTIDCGSGRDTVTADRNDKVARNCEVVRRR